MAAYSAKIKGASKIYIVDRVDARLDLAAEYAGATPINFEEEDPVKQIQNDFGGEVNKGVDAVGYQALEPETDVGSDAYDSARENPAVVLNPLIDVMKPKGRLGIIGLHVLGPGRARRDGRPGPPRHRLREALREEPTARHRPV